MREIHPPETDEILIARGIYHTYWDRLLQDDVEQWSIHERPDKTQVVRVDRQINDFHQDYGSVKITYLVEVVKDKVKHDQRLAARLNYSSDKTPKKQINIDCGFSDNTIKIARIVDDREHQCLEVDLSEISVVFPIDSILLSSLAVAEITQKSDDEVKVLNVGTVYAHILGFQEDRLLRVHPWTVYTFLHSSSGSYLQISVANEVFTGQPRKVVLGETTGRTMYVWFDKYGIPLKVDIDYGEVEHQLVQYVRKPAVAKP